MVPSVPPPPGMSAPTQPSSPGSFQVSGVGSVRNAGGWGGEGGGKRSSTGSRPVWNVPVPPGTARCSRSPPGPQSPRRIPKRKSRFKRSDGSTSSDTTSSVLRRQVSGTGTERHRETAPGNGTGKRHRASAGVGSGNGEMAPGTRTGRRHRETGTETGRYREPEPGVGYRRASPAPGAPLGTSGSSVPPPTGAAEHQKDPLPPHTQPVPEVGTDPPLSGTAAAAAPHRSAGNAASERTGSGTAARGGQ